MRRADAACARILKGIVERRARWVILDLTGVALADQAVVRQLLLIAQSVHLLGAEALFTGISAEMAQMLVELDIDLHEFRSVATLEAGIASVLDRATGAD
jgi:rsbT co-antagonist protein RsbR